jgi:integrase
MAKVTYTDAWKLYDATGRSWEADAALPWLMASAMEVATRVVRRVEAQRRAQVGARPTQAVDAVPAWLDAGVRRGRELATRVVAEGGGTSPLHVALRLTSHGLRRTVTDLLRQAGVDPVVAKSLVGHTTDRMREHYSFVRPAEVRDAADRVAGLVFGETV